MLPLIAFTGRFQPFHCQHLEMVRFALQHASQILIGITNPDAEHREQHPSSRHRHLAESNPLSLWQRRQLIEAALIEDGLAKSSWDIVAFPLDQSERWPALVPLGTPQLVRVFSEWEREKVRRFEMAGYPTLVIEGDPAERLSASDVRTALRNTQQVPTSVPPGARELLGCWFNENSGAWHGG